METQMQAYDLSTQFLQHPWTLPLLKSKQAVDNSSLDEDEGFFNLKSRKDSLKEENELPVYGMYIHEDIVPGMRYRVRQNGTNKWFFDGNAKYLEHIGQGYGKRLTFQSENVLENENFFWSDSNPLFGYSFFIQVLFAGDTFMVKENETDVGMAYVSQADEEQDILFTESRDKEIQKDVRVRFEYFLRKEDDVENEVSRKAEGIVSLVKRMDQKRFEVRSVKVFGETGGKLSFSPLSMN